MRSASGGRRSWGAGRAGIVALLAVLAGAVLPVAPAAAAPVPFSPTPLAGWSTNGTVRAVLVVGDTVYVGGAFTEVRPPSGSPVPRARLAAFDVHTGALRTGFVADANAPVRALATDGSRLFVGGSFSQISGANRSRIAALSLTTGVPVAGFTSSTNNNVYSLRVHGSRLYLGGTFTSVLGQPRGRVAAVSAATGALDPGFAPDVDDEVNAVVVSPDGARVYVGGDFGRVNGVNRPYIATLTSSGTLTSQEFQGSIYGEVIDLDISPAGDRIYAALGDLQNQVRAWSTASDRIVWSHVVAGDTQAVRFWGGNVYFGFHDGDRNDPSVRMLAADAATGVIESSYRLPINSFYGVWDIDASADGLVLGGEFTRVSGVAVQGVAILPGATASVSIGFSTDEAARIAAAGERFGIAGDELRSGARLLLFLDALAAPQGLDPVSPPPTSSGPVVLTARYSPAEMASMDALAARIGLDRRALHVLGVRLLQFLWVLDTQ
jgi:hypothetical protein